MKINNHKCIIASMGLIALYAAPALGQAPAAVDAKPLPWLAQAPVKPVHAATPQPSTFEQMLAYVYEYNPKLASERDNVAIADEKVSQANSGFRPNVNANAAVGRQREETGESDWVYGKANSESIAAVQPIFNGFGTLAQRRAADQRVLAARARMLAVEQNVLMTAIGDWLDMCEREKLLSLAEDNLHSMSIYNNASLSRFNAGDGTKTDIQQTQSRLAQAKARQAIAMAERDAARAAFERDTGLAAPAASFPPLPSGLPKTEEEAEKRARNNPQMRQAEYEEKAAQEDIESAKSALWPSVYLRAGVDKEYSPTLGLDNFRNDSITLNVSIPLYQGGGEYSRVREAKLTHEKSITDAIDAGRDVVGRARFSWYNYQSAQAVIDASQQASKSAAQAVSGIEEEQRQGLRTLTDVLEEQSELLNTQISETQAQKNVRLEAYHLMAATGELTAQGLNLPGQHYEPKAHYDDVSGRWAGLDTEVPPRLVPPGSPQ